LTRTGDPAVVTALRHWVGQSLFAPGNGAMAVILAANPHRAFLSRIGRVEVFQPIPPPNGKSPEGPHTHVLPKLLRHKRTQAATEPLPAGWIPCAHFFPPHPVWDQFGHRRPFREQCHAAFQTLLARYGDSQFNEIKRCIAESVIAGPEASAAAIADDRHGRATVRVALRQLKASGRSLPALAAWLSAYDRFDPADEDSTDEHRCTA
jgi:hypothetical protein